MNVKEMIEILSTMPKDSRIMIGSTKRTNTINDIFAVDFGEYDGESWSCAEIDDPENDNVKVVLISS